VTYWPGLNMMGKWLFVQQMKLNQRELNQALRCRLDRDGYIELLRRKGIL
jgi:hypothetical protein